MIEELRAFLLARYDEEERETVIPAAFTASTWMSAPTRAKLLADLKAKRTIVETVRRWIEVGHPTLDHVLFQLATVYANHPDYRPEWRP